LTGTGVLPLTLSNTLLSFGKVGENSPSAPKTTTLFNNEAVALNISITLSNPDNAETDTCKGSVAAKGYCTISVTLTPTVLGADNGTLNVTDAASNNPQTAALTGTGTGAVASLSPSRLTFTSQPVDTASVGQVIILANTGNLPLTLSATSFHLAGANADDFAQVNTCSLSLAAGNNCPIAILFTPSAVGTRGASMTITDNALGSPQSVSLSGTGTHDVILSWTPSATPGIAGYNVYRGTTSGAESDRAHIVRRRRLSWASVGTIKSSFVLDPARGCCGPGSLDRFSDYHAAFAVVASMNASRGVRWPRRSMSHSLL